MKLAKKTLTLIAQIWIGVMFVGLISTHATVGYILAVLLGLFYIADRLDKRYNKRVGF